MRNFFWSSPDGGGFQPALQVSLLIPRWPFTRHSRRRTGSVRIFQTVTIEKPAISFTMENSLD